MAGVTEAPFRGICKRMGAGLTYTEMVSAKGLHYNPDSRVSRALLTFSPEETPCAVQIFGAEPELMAAQARDIVDRYGDDVALIDINMGCPVTKVVAKGEGSALMREPELRRRDRLGGGGGGRRRAGHGEVPVGMGRRRGQRPRVRAGDGGGGRRRGGRARTHAGPVLQGRGRLGRHRAREGAR